MPDPSHLAGILSRAWYQASIAEFLQSDTDSIIGRLAQNSDFTLLPAQMDAWLVQLRFLQNQLIGFAGSLFMEFNIPRMGRRIDTVLLSGPIVFVVEFKVGADTFDRAAIDQVWDYALDLKNFHSASHSVPIVPILLATGARELPGVALRADSDRVYRPLSVNPVSFRPTLDLVLQSVKGEPINEQLWFRAPYRPTPTIVEAARALYAQHSVEAIARSDAGHRICT